MAEVPSNLKFTKEHEWVALSGEKHAAIGVTSFAIEQLGDIVHLELPRVGESFEAGASFGTIESTKTVSDLYCPVKAKITEINLNLIDHLDGLAADPYQKGWLVKAEVLNASDLNTLLSASEYEAFLKSQS